jgi:hypothetical protein
MSDSLTFRLLRYIKASAETLNFTRAAEQIFVAQSSLSHQIGKLEDNIDVAIFDRLQNGAGCSTQRGSSSATWLFVLHQRETTGEIPRRVGGSSGNGQLFRTRFFL